MISLIASKADTEDKRHFHFPGGAGEKLDGSHQIGFLENRGSAVRKIKPAQIFFGRL